jgi:hypothetical protein
MLGEICQKGISIVDIMVVTRNIEFYFFNFKTNKVELIICFKIKKIKFNISCYNHYVDNRYSFLTYFA